MLERLKEKLPPLVIGITITNVVILVYVLQIDQIRTHGEHRNIILISGIIISVVVGFAIRYLIGRIIIHKNTKKMEELSEKLLYDLRRQVESAGLSMDPQAMNALTTIVNTGLDKNFQKGRSLESVPDLSQLSSDQQRMMETNSRIFADAIIRNAGSGTVEMDTLFKSVRMICPLWPIC